MMRIANGIAGRLLVCAAAAAVLAVLLVTPGVGSPEPQDKKQDNKYIGAEKCKNCHEAKTKGQQFTTWKATGHAKAFEALASDEAKKIAKEKGIEDPQKSEKCLKCHLTAFAEEASHLGSSFKREMGIQCETCHGPGEKHFKARMAAASDEEGESDDLAEVPDGEIIKHPGPKTCLTCHNEESPNFKPFCFKERFAKIMHLDPRKKRTEEQLKEMKCGCADHCKAGCACKQGECGGFEDKK